MKHHFRYTALAVLLSIMLTSAAFGADNAEVADEVTYGGKSLCEYASVGTDIQLRAKSAYVVNLDTGTVIFEKNSEETVYPASTVKLLTALVAYENIPDPDVSVTVSDQVARNASGSNMALKGGEILTARDLLYGVLTVGANDAAAALAEYVSGDEAAFCELMNQKAADLGANNSHFDNVTGFHSESTYSTARDIAVIAKSVYYNDELFEMTNTPRYTVEATNKTDSKRTLINRNTLISRIRSQDYYYPGARGMSLGGTPEGGQCAVSALTTDDNLTYLCIILGSEETEDKNYACLDMAEIFNLCSDSFSLQTVASTNDVICEIPVRLAANTDYVTLFPMSDVKALLPKNLDYENDIKLEKRVYDEYAKAPVYKGDVFGEIVVLYKSDAVVGKTKLVSETSIDRSNVLYFLSRIEGFVSSTWFKVFAVTAVILFIIYFALSIYVSSRRKGRNGKYRR